MQTIVNLGTGGAALNGQNGSTTSADSNDALFLAWPGDNGGNYVYLPGVSGNYLSVPDQAALDITGDIDIRVRVAMENWTPATINSLISKWSGTVGQNAYDFYVATSGNLVLNWSADGTTTIAKTSTAAPSVTNGQDIWLRVTLDVDNGASGNDVKFWTSADGITFTQLGSTVTTAGITSIFVGNLDLRIGQRVGGSALPLAGKLYRAQVLNGINGTTVLDLDTSVIASSSATSLAAVTGQTVTINRSTTGRKSVAVCQPTWLLGTDDFMQVADDALLDFEKDDQFSVVYAYRVWPTPGSFTSLFNKRLSVADSFDLSRQGYGSRMIGTSSSLWQVNSDTHYVTSTLSGLSAGLRFGVMRYNGLLVNNQVTHFLDGTTGTNTLLGGATFNNALPFRIGANSAGMPGDYGEFEFYAIAVFRRLLTDTERDAVVSYFTNRIK